MREAPLILEEAIMRTAQKMGCLAEGLLDTFFETLELIIHLVHLSLLVDVLEDLHLHGHVVGALLETLDGLDQLVLVLVDPRQAIHGRLQVIYVLDTSLHLYSERRVPDFVDAPLVSERRSSSGLFGGGGVAVWRCEDLKVDPTCGCRKGFATLLQCRPFKFGRLRRPRPRIPRR